MVDFPKCWHPCIVALFAYFLFFAISTSAACASDIILDPGHNPHQPGAISCTGVYEYKYNDKLAREVEYALNNSNVDTKLTREPQQDKSLTERTLDTQNARLFISLHHDSVQPQFIEYINGHPMSTKAEGYSIFVSRKNKYFNQSVEYAKRLAMNLRAMGLSPSTHHGEKIKGENRQVLDKELGIYIYDDLIVLKKSQCPAILYEAGVIVNPSDEKRVRGKEFKSKVSQAIVNTVISQTD